MNRKLILIPLLAWTYAAQAQPAPATSANLRFLSYGEVLRGWNCVAGEPGKSAKEVPLPVIPNRFRSQPFKYQGSPTVALFDGPVPSPQPGAPPPVPAATFAMPDGARNVLVVLFPMSGDSGGAPSHAAVAINDDTSFFPYGTFLFFNLTAHDLIGKIGGKIFQFGKGQTTVVNPGVPAGGMNITVYDPREKDRPLLQQAWDYQPKSRVVVFLREIAKPRPYLAVASVAEFEGTAGEPAGTLDVKTLSEQNSR